MLSSLWISPFSASDSPGAAANHSHVSALTLACVVVFEACSVDVDAFSSSMK